MSEQESSEQPKKGGRKRRGDRRTKTVRYPTAWHEHLEQRAREAGLGDDLGSYITMALAEHEQLPVPDYISHEIEVARLKQEAAERRRQAAEHRSAEEITFPKSA